MNIYKEDDWLIEKEGHGRKPFKLTPEIIDRASEEDKEWDNHFKRWQPNEGEWCWFWSDNYTKPVLTKFIRLQKNVKYCYQTNERYFEHCEPFIGELPSTIKDHQ